MNSKLLLIGIIFTGVGMFMFFFPPKNINMFFGYKTSSSMKNQESWDFAQTYSAKRMIEAGIITILLSISTYFIPINGNWITPIIIFASIIYILYTTEKALKKS